jgi:hypothetical protein
MTIPFQGGCSCGAVRYKCSAEPYTAFFCHCLDCQKNTGAPFSVDVIVPIDAVEITGELKGYKTTTDSNDEVTRKFCSKCGTPVLNQPHSFPDIIALKVSSLDDPGWIQPQAHLWTIRKQPWLRLGDDLPKYERNM